MKITDTKHPFRVALGPAWAWHHDVRRALWVIAHSRGAYVEVDDEALDRSGELPWAEMAEKLNAAAAECCGRLEVNAGGIVTPDGFRGWIKVIPC